MSEPTNKTAQTIPDSQQMVLQIFENFKLDGRTIEESPSEIRYRKHNLFIDVSDLGLVARKALNACHYVAASSPIDPTGSYTVDLNFFRWLINYDKSNNLAHLKKALREAQKSAVQVNIIDAKDPTKDSWASVPMLGATGISGGKVIFRIPEEIRPHLLEPGSYTYLSLRITAAFTSSYALTLYEKLASQLYRGGTDWFEIEAFREWISAGNIKTLSEFKNLKRYVLTPALAQINELSDIRVDYVTKATSGTKRITHLKFTVRDNPDGRLNLRSGYKDAIHELYNILTGEFGLSEELLDEIMADRETYTDERIRAAVDFTRARVANSKKDVTYPGLYLMNALRKNLRLSEVEDAQRKMKSGKKQPSPAEKKEADKDMENVTLRNRAKIHLATLAGEEVGDLLATFEAENISNKQLVKAIKDKGMGSKMVEVPFLLWIGKRLSAN